MAIPIITRRKKYIVQILTLLLLNFLKSKNKLTQQFIFEKHEILTIVNIANNFYFACIS